jgi:cytochrome c oxidase subunit 4
MSDQAHGHHAAPDHVPHVTPLWVYLATWGALVFLTAVTVGVSYVNFGPANLIIALVIATIKAAVVSALFMHLLHDQRYHTLILLSGGLFLSIFVAFTMFDTEFRGRAEKIEAERVADITRPFDGTASQKTVKAKWLGAGSAASAPANPPGMPVPGPAVPLLVAPAASVAPASPAPEVPSSASAAVAPASAAPASSAPAAPAAGSAAAHP